MWRSLSGLVVAVAAAFVAFGPARAAAQPETPNASPEAIARVYACADIQDDQQRLACFDAATAALREAERTGDLVALDQTQVRTMRQGAFGFSLPNLDNLFARSPDAEEMDSVQLQVERVASRGHLYAFIMTDGQVWVQTEAQRANNVREGDTVTIRRGVLGSFFLVSQRGGSDHRVRREN